MKRIFIGVQKCLANAECEFLHVSDRFLERTGYTRAEIREIFHDSFLEMVCKEDRERVRAEFLSQIAQGDSFVLEYRLYARDGELLWLYEQGHVAEEDGVRICYFDSADASLYKSVDTYYQNLLHSLPNPIMTTDLRRRITFVNRAMERDIGMPAAECIGRDSALVTSEQYESSPSTLVHLANGRINRVDLAPHCNAMGKQIGYVSVSTDVTEMIEAERESRLNEQRYRIALGQTRSSIWEYDLSSGVAYRTEVDADGNNRLRDLAGQMPYALLDTGRIHPDSAEGFMQMFRDIHAGKSDSRCTVRVCGQDDTTYWLSFIYSMVYDEDGNPLRVIGVAREVTAEKEHELQLLQEKRYRDSLVSDALCTFEVNLTRDRVTCTADEGEENLCLEADDTYSVMVARNLDKTIHPAFQETLRAHLGREALLEAYRNGQREVSCEYQRRDRGGRMVWVRDTAYLVESVENGDICALIRLKDIDHQKRQAMEMQKKAERDPLTGLLNRGTTRMLANRCLSEEQGKLCALFMLDIDNFKRINDTYGHLFGDAVLAETAARLSGLFRHGDLLARMGGDEFLVFLRCIPDREAAFRKAEQICGNMRAVYASGGNSCEISGSLGIAFAPDDGEAFDVLYEKADAALYRAKDLGKNRYAVYSGELTTSDKTAQPHLDSHMHICADNLEEHCFQLLYQSRDMEVSINAVLELFCMRYDSPHAYVVEYNPIRNAYSMSYEWCSEGFAYAKKWMQNVPAAEFTGYERTPERETFYCVDNLDEVDSSTLLMAQRVGAQSYLHCPLHWKGQFLGFMGIDEAQAPCIHAQSEREHLYGAMMMVGGFLNSTRSDRAQLQLIHALESALEGVGGAYYVLDPCSREVVFASRLLAEQFPAMTPGEKCYAHLRGGHAPCADCLINQLLETNHGGTARMGDHAGMTWSEVAANWVKWSDGRDYCVVCCMPKNETE